jgi:hypothetical protein
VSEAGPGGAAIATGGRPRGRWGVASALVAGWLVLAATGTAQASFRVSFDVDRSQAARTRVAGVVFNDARVEALDVYVTAEALDAAGEVVARGVAFVSPNIREGTSAPFEALVPAPATAARFRVRVTGFRFGLGAQSP